MYTDIDPEKTIINEINIIHDKLSLILNGLLRIDNNYSCGINGIDILQGYKTVDEGSSGDYQDLLNFLKKNSLSDQKNYQYIKQKMDVRNFINFWIHQIFYANHDVRGNIRFWKSDSLDNKFRWIVYDTDLGFGPNRVNKDLLKDFTSSRMTDWYNPNWATFLLRNLLESNEFKKDFILNNGLSFLEHSTIFKSLKSRNCQP